MCHSWFAYRKYYQWSLWWLQFSFDPHDVTRALGAFVWLWLCLSYGISALSPFPFVSLLFSPKLLLLLRWAHQWEKLKVLTLSGGGQCQVRDLLLGYHQISGRKAEHRVALSFSACHVISFICWQLPERHRRLSSLSCHN